MDAIVFSHLTDAVSLGGHVPKYRGCDSGGPPLNTHRAVEALRIALGLGTGGNPLSIVLLGEAPLLLTDDTDNVVDAEILEKYLPSFKQLETPFLLPMGSRSRFQFDPDFHVQEASRPRFRSLCPRPTVPLCSNLVSYE